MKYKVGDKVKIRSWESMAAEYGVEDDKLRIKTPTFYFTPEMQKYCGKVFRIESVAMTFYRVRGIANYLTDEMIECAVKDSNIQKAEIHARICQYMTELYKRKNEDYGDSFAKSYTEYGAAMPCIRLDDKLSRFKKLTLSGKQKVNDESAIDTLVDLANYAVMTLIEMGFTGGD